MHLHNIASSPVSQFYGWHESVVKTHACNPQKQMLKSTIVVPYFEHSKASVIIYGC